jgi:hypothetical protein
MCLTIAGPSQQGEILHTQPHHPNPFRHQSTHITRRGPTRWLIILITCIIRSRKIRIPRLHINRLSRSRRSRPRLDARRHTGTGTGIGTSLLLGLKVVLLLGWRLQKVSLSFGSAFAECFVGGLAGLIGSDLRGQLGGVSIRGVLLVRGFNGASDGGYSRYLPA